MNGIVFLLEYSYKDKQIHMNTVDINSMEFGHPLFSNDFHPVCVIPQKLREKERFNQFLYRLVDRHVSYKTFFHFVTLVVANFVEKGHFIEPSDEQVEEVDSEYPY